METGELFCNKMLNLPNKGIILFQNWWVFQGVSKQKRKAKCQETPEEATVLGGFKVGQIPAQEISFVVSLGYCFYFLC